MPPTMSSSSTQRAPSSYHAPTGTSAKSDAGRHRRSTLDACGATGSQSAPGAWSSSRACTAWLVAKVFTPKPSLGLVKRPSSAGGAVSCWDCSHATGSWARSSKPPPRAVTATHGEGRGVRVVRAERRPRAVGLQAAEHEGLGRLEDGVAGGRCRRPRRAITANPVVSRSAEFAPAGSPSKLQPPPVAFSASHITCRSRLVDVLAQQRLGQPGEQERVEERRGVLVEAGGQVDARTSGVVVTRVEVRRVEARAARRPGG